MARRREATLPQLRALENIRARQLRDIRRRIADLEAQAERDGAPEPKPEAKPASG